MRLCFVGVLLCGLMGMQAAQAQDELNVQTLQELLLPDGGRAILENGEGFFEETRGSEGKMTRNSLRGRLAIFQSQNGVSLVITTENRPAEVHITWRGKNADARTGFLAIGGRFPIVTNSPQSSFEGSNSLRRTEDGQGLELEETHFPFYDGPYEKGPKSRRTDMQKVEVVIRPNKIRFLIKCLGPATSPGYLKPQVQQRIVMEFDR